MSPVIAAITRHDVADYLNTLLQIYIVLIFIRILMSWIPRMPYNRYLNAVLNFVRDVTDPYLNLFRKFVPMVRIGPGALDLSPIVATVVLIIVGQIIVGLVDGPCRRAPHGRARLPRQPWWWRSTRPPSSSRSTRSSAGRA